MGRRFNCGTTGAGRLDSVASEQRGELCAELLGEAAGRHAEGGAEVRRSVVAIGEAPEVVEDGAMAVPLDEPVDGEERLAVGGGGADAVAGVHPLAVARENVER